MKPSSYQPGLISQMKDRKLFLKMLPFNFILTQLIVREIVPEFDHVISFLVRLLTCMDKFLFCHILYKRLFMW